MRGAYISVCNLENDLKCSASMWKVKYFIYLCAGKEIICKFFQLAVMLIKTQRNGTLNVLPYLGCLLFKQTFAIK